VSKLRLAAVNARAECRFDFSLLSFAHRVDASKLLALSLHANMSNVAPIIRLLFPIAENIRERVINAKSRRQRPLEGALMQQSEQCVRRLCLVDFYLATHR